MTRSTSKLRGRRAVAAVLLALLLPLGLAPAAAALDADGSPLAATTAGRGVLADLWDLLALVFLGGENRSQIDPDGATDEEDNRGGIDPNGATDEGDNGLQIDPNG